MVGLPAFSAHSAANRGGMHLLLLLALYFLLTWPVIIFGGGGTSEAWDQDEHHVLVIEQFSASLRGVEGAPPLRKALEDYPSATSPGFHLAIASLDAVGVQSRTLQRLVASLAGAAVLAVLWMAVGRVVDPLTATVLSLPLLASPYLLSGSIWMTTDVSALLWSGVAVASLLIRPLTPRWILAAGFAAAIAVFIRQTSIWIVAPVAVAAWIAHRDRLSTGSISSLRDRRSAIWQAAIPAILMPCAVLAVLVSLWGGIVPPSYRTQHASGFNPTLPAVALALLGLWGMPWMIRARAWPSPRMLVAAVVVGAIAAMLPATDFNRDAGRWGGPIWQLVERAPDVMNRSVVIVLLACLGAITLAGIVSRTPMPQARSWRITLAAVALSLIAALSANSQAWERYVDLPLLAFLPLAVVAVRGARPDWTPTELRLPFLALAIVQIAMSVVMVYLPAFRG
jgi:hypothetical protein